MRSDETSVIDSAVRYAKFISWQTADGSLLAAQLKNIQRIEQRHGGVIVIDEYGSFELLFSSVDAAKAFYLGLVMAK